MLVDHAVAARIEGALAADVTAFVAGLCELDRRTGDSSGARASSEAVAGGWAHFTGPGLFGNRVQGAGLGGPVEPDDLAKVERFYRPRGLPAEMEICPHADPTLLRLAGERGWRPIGFRNVYVHDSLVAPSSSSPDIPSSDDIEVVPVGEEDFPVWSQLLLDGFGYSSVADRQRVAWWNQMLFRISEATLLLARRQERPVGVANVLFHGDVASLGGTTTLPEFRGRGVQAALLRARLNMARERGCTLAVVTADPGSTSARNCQRAGFTLAYTNVRLRG